jgi:hypothetical protein
VLGEMPLCGLLETFDLGSDGRLSDGPVASGRLASIWRLDTDAGSWAVKQMGDLSRDELTEVLEGAAFEEAAVAAGVPVPAVRRTVGGDVIADLDRVRARVHAWVDLDEPNTGLDPVAVGRLVAALHQVDFAGTVGVDPWYTEPVGARRWAELGSARSTRLRATCRTARHRQ